MEWLKTLLADIRFGHHAFIVQGNIGDGFPLLTSNDEPSRLFPWYGVASHMLCGVNAEYLTWLFDPALGFVFPNPADEEAYARAFAGAADKEQDSSQQDSDDIMAQLRRQSASDDDATPKRFVQAVPSMMRVMAALTQDNAEVQPCVALLHDADAVWNQTQNDERTTLAFLELLRIAENETFRKAGHVLILATPSASRLPERLCRPDSPFRVITINRPSEAERATFVESVVVASETLDAQLAEIRAARVEHERTAALRIDTDIAAMEARIAVFKASNSFNEGDLVSANSNECKRLVDEAHQRVFGALAPFHLNAKSIHRVRVGDSIAVSAPAQLDGTQRQTVLAATNGQLQLSTTKSATELMVRHKDGTPVLFYWDSKHGYSQRSSVEPVVSAVVTTPNGMVFWCVPKGHAEARAQLDAAVANLDAAQTEEAEAVAKAAKTVAAAREQLAKLQAEIEQLRAKKAAIGMGGVSDSEYEREARALLTGRFLAPACGVPTFARLTQGMGYRDITTVLRTAQNNGVACDDATLLAMRRAVLQRSYGHLVEIVDPIHGFDDIAGLDYIKQRLLRVRDDIKAGLLARVPMGMLLMGPPGTGKTAIAEALAQECGFLFVKIKNVRSMWVGETERQMEELTACLRSLAPVVVLRDEVDQEDTGRDSYQGDSGVSARVRGTWMQFLSDEQIRGKVLVVSCTNRPDLLDAAMKRRSRTDELVPVLMPDERTRRALFPVMLRLYQKDLPGMTVESTLTKHDLARLAKMTNGRSGADIKAIVRHAAEDAVVDGTTIRVGFKEMKDAVEDLLPGDSSEQVARMTLAALSACSRQKFLPPNAKEIAEQCMRTLDAKTVDDTKAKDEVLREVLEQHRESFGKA